MADTFSELPKRYEIRRLQPEHVEWVNMMAVYNNLFDSPVWSVVLPRDKSALFDACMDSSTTMTEHRIASGHSIGIFDRDYVYRTPEAAKAGGKLYYRPVDKLASGESTAHTEQSLLEAMDFPLVSIALASDAAIPLDPSHYTKILEALPLYGTFQRLQDRQDMRPAEVRKPKSSGEVLMRNGTSTRPDYVGRGLMGALARWQMHDAPEQGFRGIEIDSMHPAITKVWTSPPAPFEAQVVVEVDSATYEEDDGQGRMVKPFAPSEVLLTRIRVQLRKA